MNAVQSSYVNFNEQNSQGPHPLHPAPNQGHPCSHCGSSNQNNLAFHSHHAPAVDQDAHLQRQYAPQGHSYLNNPGQVYYAINKTGNDYHQQKITDIEINLIRDFGFYYCCIYLCLFLCCVGFISLFLPHYQPPDEVDKFFRFIVCFILTFACSFALWARASLKSGTQRKALITFYLGFSLDLFSTLKLLFTPKMSYWESQKMNEQDFSTLIMCMIPLLGVLYYIIIMNSHKALNLMREREHIVYNASDSWTKAMLKVFG